MKPLVCIYCEGNDVKLSVISREKDSIRVHRTITTALTGHEGGSDSEQLQDFSDDSSDELSFDSLDSETDVAVSSGESDSGDLQAISASLSDINLNQAQFIPIITDPSINFHIYEGEEQKDKSKFLDLIIEDIQKSKGIPVAKDTLDYVHLNGNSYLCVFTEDSIPCVNLVNAFASINNRRYYKIASIKCAEIALANYVSKTTKFFPEDYTLVIYIGREYSKLIFLEGQKLKHIGTTLDIGTQNLHTYDVYFSKILLEMENGGIPRLDNVVLCGDDRSENLVLSFYGTFPEANVSELKFDLFDLSDLPEEDHENISAYSIPISGAYEYYAEQDKELSGINILPRYILENQKFLQFGWHSYAIFPLLFAATFLFTYLTLSNYKEIDELDKEIKNLKELEIQNKAIVSQISPLTKRIANFDNTQAILDSATAGTEIWGHTVENVSNFIERRRNFWVSHWETGSANQILLKGYSLSRSVLTEFAEYNNSSILRNVLYEPLRDKNAFAYNINFNLRNKPK